MLNSKEKRKIDEWEAFHGDLKRQSAVDSSTTRSEREAFRKTLEKDPTAWIKEMFPTYCRCEFAGFQTKAIKRITANAEWYEVLSWSRSLAKSTITFMAVSYLVLTGKKRNLLLISNSLDNAKRLLKDYKQAFENNSRIKHYYGEQVTYGLWTDTEFITRGGASFRAVGAGQSPRGTRNEAYRPDTFIIDDFDTDEDCRNHETIRNKWDWWEQAVYAARDTDIPVLIVFCGNVISKDCCVVRAGKMADHWDKINILDAQGQPSWPQKNTAEEIQNVLSKVSAASAQKEYFNNPVIEGGVFKELTYGKCPPLKALDFVVYYADPSPSNKDRQKAGVSFKAGVVIGYKDGFYYLYKCFLEQTNTTNFISWFYAIRDYVNERTQVFYYIENNTLQDPFYEQVYKPLFEQETERQGYIPITPDTRKKPDKGIRIEGNLEPLVRNGKLIFNETKKENPHFARLAEQFLFFTPQSKFPSDGADAVEGGIYIINQKLRSLDIEVEFGDFKKFHKNTY